jgi:two-component system, NarL family, response regulator YdfI
MFDGIRSECERRKFLIVDDHAAFRQSIRPFLPAGTVVECGDGSEALAAYAIEHPDWVLMDVEMPGMDGLTAIRELRQQFPDVRIIIITNHGEEDLRAAAMDLGAVGFLLKEHLADLAPIILSGEKQRTNT